MEEIQEQEGWTWMHNATKFHYFVKGMSLCRKWALWNAASHSLEKDVKSSPDNCKVCYRKAVKRLGENE